MDLAFRYLVLVQVITRNGYDVFFGSAPDFGIEVFETVDPGNVSQEYMFHLKLRRMIGESLSVYKAEGKELPLIRSTVDFSPRLPGSSQNPQSNLTEMVSTSVAAKMLGVHPDTIRRLFDSGVLKGSLSKGRQRMILLVSLQEEEARMTHRVECRKLELRAKHKNLKRRKRRVQKQREKRSERLKENLAELNPSEFHNFTK